MLFAGRWGFEPPCGSGVKYFCDVSWGIQPLVDWISSIPFEEWPQQHRIRPKQLRPAMVTDREWYGFGSRVGPLVYGILGTRVATASLIWDNPMLSVVMPGDDIPSHTDELGPTWLTRVHVPLMTNNEALFLSEGVQYHMEVSAAYKVNTRARHAIVNGGSTPRIHFMFDVRGVPGDAHGGVP